MTLPAALQDRIFLDRLTAPQQNWPKGLRSEDGGKYGNYKTCLFDCRIYLFSEVSETEKFIVFGDFRAGNDFCFTFWKLWFSFLDMTFVVAFWGGSFSFLGVVFLFPSSSS